VLACGTGVALHRFVNDFFHRVATRVSVAAGSPSAFALAVLTILLWGASGPVFGFSDTWQLVINTGTTILTFLMVFLIQNSQNRDSRAMNVKLDELIRALDPADDAFIAVESLGDAEFEALARKVEAARTRRAERPRSAT